MSPNRTWITTLLLFVFCHVDAQKKVAPQHKLGDFEFRSALLENFIKPPQVAIDSCIHGSVVAEFKVRTDGSLDSIRILHSVNRALDEHALKFIYQTNNQWIPGSIDGVPVEMRKTIVFVYGSFREHKDDQNYNLAQISLLRKISGEFLNCPEAHDHYVKAKKHLKAGEVAAAHYWYNKAHQADFLHLDAIDGLKKTSNELGLDCNVCEKLALLSRYSPREIKRVRDRYCTKSFEPLD